MQGFFSLLGIGLFSCLIILLLKWFAEAREWKYGQIAGARYVYQAATDFSKGADHEKVVATMLKCSYFSRLEVEKIVAAAERKSADDPYHFFLAQVNAQIGSDIF